MLALLVCLALAQRSSQPVGDLSGDTDPTSARTADRPGGGGQEVDGRAHAFAYFEVVYRAYGFPQRAAALSLAAVALPFLLSVVLLGLVSSASSWTVTPRF
ncbi:MAG: hypothetical protein ACM3NQ_03650 [Bacteroidales bacterium]